MPDPYEPAYGMIALCVAALLVVLLLAVSVKLRAISGRRFGVHVYDFGAHLDLPPTLHSRSYRFALYLTMKSLPREPAEPHRRISVAASPR
jgi:hypothetical protein